MKKKSLELMIEMAELWFDEYRHGKMSYDEEVDYETAIEDAKGDLA